jgi:hypothetical protein
MIKRFELASPVSCLNRADADEPIFVLRANDPDAPAVIREWADRYATRKEDENDGRVMNVPQIAKYREAVDLANSMEEWRKAQASREAKS